MLLKSLLIWAACGIFLIGNDFKLRDHSILIEGTNSINITNRPVLIIYGEKAIPEVIYRYMQHDNLIGLKNTLNEIESKQTEKDVLQETIITNTVVKYETKEKIVEVKNKKRVIIVAVLSGTLSAILGGYLGYKIKEKITIN